ncbi:hypothetical protein AQUSIP_10840 [Aquicella siphonis]|uniref:Uncharacterized protein n=1 Tax=Aquicella siphonis TaxID=254247 RepID=A0A5E4PH63_9COXI|nr:hypothetical protein AQUSIP_10840 [Aquicella siphonis]
MLVKIGINCQLVIMLVPEKGLVFSNPGGMAVL